MRDVIERFVGRYQVWRDHRPSRNPLTRLAWMFVIAIVLSLRDILLSHEITWLAAIALIVDIVFVILYFRRSPWAWLILPIWGTTLLLELPFMLASWPHRYPTQVRIAS